MIWIFFVIVVSGSGVGTETDTYRFPDPETCEYVREALVDRTRNRPLTYVTPCKEFQAARESRATPTEPSAQPRDLQPGRPRGAGALTL